MKRSEMVEHISEELEDMLKCLENRPKTRPHICKRYANDLLDMIEGFEVIKGNWEEE